MTADLELPEFQWDATAILLYGGGGHGRALIDLLRVLNTYQIAGIIDDQLPAGSDIMGVPVLGGAELLPQVFSRGVHLAINAVGGIGNVNARIQVFQKLAQTGFSCPALVHPTAFVEPSAHLHGGVQVFPNAYIGSLVEVGFGSVVNLGAQVGHDCKLGRCVNLSPGAMLAGGAQIEDYAQIGMNATINLRLTVGKRARVGNSAVVKKDVLPGTVVYAGTIHPARSERS